MSTSRLVMVLGLALLTAASGCHRKPARQGAGQGKGARDAAARLREAAPKSNLTVTMAENRFVVDDEIGRRLLEADVDAADGKMTAGQGIDGVVKMAKTRARLFKAGKLQMTMETNAATWDGKQLVSQAPVHAVTAEQDKVIDATQATWTAGTGQIDLQTAKLHSMAGKKVEFTADAPRASVLDKVATMNSGATGKSAAGDTMRGDRVRWNFDTKLLEANGNADFANTDGGRLQADTVKWNLGTGKLDATGRVRLTDEGTVVTGARLAADTKLKRGRLSGGTRVVMKKGALGKSLAKKNG
jgi:lipopolysaccharide export system protein LptA